MGWRERDYARLTRRERDELLGSRPARTSYGRVGLRRAIGWAVAITATLGVAGHVPRGHPLVPALRFGVRGPARADSQVLALSVPAADRRGRWIGVHSQTPKRYHGRLVVLEASWNGGSWRVVDTSRIGRGGAVSVGVKLRRHGLLRLRLTFPDGTVALGQTRVF